MLPPRRRPRALQLAIQVTILLVVDTGFLSRGRADEAPLAGCGKDTDCKGARICVQQQCVDPPEPPGEPRPSEVKPPTPPTPPPPPPPPPEPPAPPLPQPEESSSLTLNLFGEARIYASDEPDSASGVPTPQFGFKLANVDLFAIGKIARKFFVLAELNVEVDGTNNWEIEPERLQLSYRFRDWLSVHIGRVHAAIGYYNTAFHHGAWLETPVGRPHVVDFEDHGGLLPVHLVGLGATGHLLRGPVDFGYALEVGNGRSALATDVQQFQSKTLFKAVNGQLYLRFPRAGLRFGANVIVNQAPPADNLATLPLRNSSIDELIAGGHLVWQLSKFELLSEYYFIRHIVDGTGRESHDHGYYALVSYQWRTLRPYALFHGILYDQDVPDLFYSPTGVALPSENIIGGGLKWWLDDRLSLKLQYEHTFSTQDRNVATLQVAFGI